MVDGYRVHPGPTGPLVTITMAGGLVRTYSDTADVEAFVARPDATRWPGLWEDWLAAGPRPARPNPHPPVDEVLAMVASLNERRR